MAQTAHCGAAKKGDGAAAQRLEKGRESLFEASKIEKDRLKADTAAYRLKGTDEKFSSTTTASDVALAQATVGLMTKEEFARAKLAVESGAEPGQGSSGAGGSSSADADSKEKKKKKKKAAPGALSFAFEDEDGDDGGAEVGGAKKQKTAEPPS